MTWKQAFTSSIGKKIVMALSGIFLILFLIVHVGINACIFANDGGQMFNKAAHFMGSTVLIRILEVGLFAFFFLHIIQGFVLEAGNRTKRKSNYAVAMGSKGSKWYSRSMGLLGTLILIFLIFHWWHFWVPARFTGHPELTETTINGVHMHNMYNLMRITFQEWWVVVLYVAACGSLAFHLLHGFQSAFRTIGLANKRWLVLVQSIGWGYSIIVPLVFAAMPIAMFFGWLS
jgi:succinate dehydrogenase / fumarate reductase, cytochrome b subunit